MLEGRGRKGETNLYNAWDLVDESDSACNVIEYGHLVNLLPWHWDVLEQLEYGVWNILECAEMDTLLVSKAHMGHVAVVFDNLTEMLWREFDLFTPGSTSAAGLFQAPATLRELVVFLDFY